METRQLVGARDEENRAEESLGPVPDFASHTAT